MAAQPADNQKYSTLSVRKEGLQKLHAALKRPKKPNSKLMGLMAAPKRVARPGK